jgi:hypothetical protein
MTISRRTWVQFKRFDEQKRKRVLQMKRRTKKRTKDTDNLSVTL